MYSKQQSKSGASYKVFYITSVQSLLFWKATLFKIGKDSPILSARTVLSDYSRTDFTPGAKLKQTDLTKQSP